MNKKDNFVKEEMFLKKEFKVEHPFYGWFDGLFGKGALFHYAPHVIFSDPLKILEEVYLRFKWAYQRLIRGWDDRVIWSIDYYLCEKIPIWVKHLKKVKHGLPMEMFADDDWDLEKREPKPGGEKRAKERYDKILDDIADGFLAYKYMQDEMMWADHPEYERLNQKYLRGFNLFMEYFNTLWD